MIDSTITLDHTHRIAIVRLDPGQVLTVVAPPCTADVIGKEGTPWVIIGYDDRGVRPEFSRYSMTIARRFAGQGNLFLSINKAIKAVAKSENGRGLALIVYELRGNAIVATGEYELVEPETGWRSRADIVRDALADDIVLRQRPGDQPLPTPNGHPAIQDLVQTDIEARKALGIARYGTALQPFNGRDSLRDAYEEALDLAIYLRQAMYERDNPQ